MPTLFKTIITLFIITSFLTIVFFNFDVMMHGSDGHIQNDCPFSTMGVSLCPQDTVAMAFHHISAYNSFLNVPVKPGPTTLIISLFFVLGAALVVYLNMFLLELPVLAGIFYHFPSDVSYKRKITQWLALHENSPAGFRMPI